MLLPKSFIAILIILSTSATSAQENLSSATEIMEKVQNAFYFAGENQRTLVKMNLVNRRGNTRKRDLTYLRTNGKNGDQRYYMYFHSPSDIKNTSFLIWKYMDREDDRWLFIPAIKLVKRIAADDKASSFVGSDFTYEDISGRDISDESHILIKEDFLNERATYIVESKPNHVLNYSRRLIWVDKEHYLPLKEEFYDIQNRLARVFTANKVEKVNDIWTVTKRTMKNLINQHHTEVLFTKIEYNLKLQESLFTERSLRTPPRRWIH